MLIALNVKETDVVVGARGGRCMCLAGVHKVPLSDYERESDCIESCCSMPRAMKYCYAPEGDVYDLMIPRNEGKTVCPDEDYKPCPAA